MCEEAVNNAKYHIFFSGHDPTSRWRYFRCLSVSRVWWRQQGSAGTTRTDESPPTLQTWLPARTWNMIFTVHLSVWHIKGRRRRRSDPCDRSVNLPMEGCGEETPFWAEEPGNSSDIHSAEQNHKHAIFTPVTSIGYQYWSIKSVGWGDTHKTSVRPSAKQRQTRGTTRGYQKNIIYMFVYWIFICFLVLLTDQPM